VNHSDHEMEVSLKPGKTVPGRVFEWLDLVVDEKVPARDSLRLRVPRRGFRAFEYRAKS
jgi:hypothetical protein